MARGKQSRRQRHGRGDLRGLGDFEVPGIVKWAVALGVGWWVLNKWVGGLAGNVVSTAGTEQPPSAS
jgi:hypothetical protein